MSRYRTPDENAATEAADDAIHATLADARRDCEAVLAAIMLDEDPAVVDAWVCRLHHSLRARLSDSRLTAASSVAGR